MRDRVEQLGSPRLVCVSFAGPSLLAAFEARARPGVPLYGDVTRATYAAFGFGRGSVARVYLDPRVWVPYARALARGRLPERPEQDTLQLGGDVVVGADGRVRWIHRSQRPDDRPSLAALRAALEA